MTTPGNHPMTHRPAHPGAAAALDLARQVAGRLRDPDETAKCAARAFRDVDASLMLPGWQPASLLLGHPGIALLHTRIARDDASWRPVAHAHIAAAAAVAERESVGDLLLPAWLYARAHGGYTKLLSRAATVHASYVRARLRWLGELLGQPGQGLAYGDYDVITGLAGQGRMLLIAADQGDEAGAEALTDVLGFLVTMAGTRRVAGREVPGWWCAPDRYLVPHDRQTYPHGDFNVGAAHGICGPLALLSLAYRAGYRVPGMAAAIRRVVDWLVDVRCQDGQGVSWPGRISHDRESGRTSGPTEVSARAGWCYGTSGVAHTLHTAGQALREPAVLDLAVAAMESSLTAALPPAMTADPGVCHGLSGTLQAAVRIAAVTNSATLWEGADKLAEKIMERYDPRAPFGFAQSLRLSPTAPTSPDIDNPGLIDGAAGVALALASYADARSGVSGLADTGADWDAALLMS